MMNETTGGVSKRSLVLLGAFTALAMNRDLRRSLVQGTREAVNTAQGTLDETVKPALSSAAHQAGQTLGHFREEAGDTLSTLREEGPERARTLLSTVQEVAGTLAASAASRSAHVQDTARHAAEQAAEEASKRYSTARKEYGPKLGAISEDLLDAADERRREARKALKQVRKSGTHLLSDLGQKASTLVETATSALDDEREDIEYRVNRARRKAEKELRRTRKNWDARKLQKAVDRRVAPLQKEANRQLALLEKRHRQESRSGSGMSGTAGTVLVLGAGAIALARMPGARQRLMDTVSVVSPGAADSLHGVGRKIRGVVGDLWLEREGAESVTAGTNSVKDSGLSKANSYSVVPTDASGGKAEANGETQKLTDKPGGITPEKKGADKNGAPTRKD